MTGLEVQQIIRFSNVQDCLWNKLLSRFLSVDPFIQAAGNSQSVNPYSYIMNNPMSGTDPSGYLKVCDTFIVCSADQVDDDTFNKPIDLRGGEISNGGNSDSQQSSTSSQETTEIGSQANTAQNEGFGNIQITQNTWKDYVNDEGNVRGAIDESMRL
jgi:RHS repeat-associated protein